MPLVNRKELMAYNLQKKGYSLRQIGAQLNVTRQRALQLINNREAKKELGIFAELQTRSLRILQELDINTFEELKKRFPSFIRPDGKFRYRGCGRLVYSDLQKFIKRHETTHRKRS